MEHHTDVTYAYDDELDLIYLQGTKNDVQSTFVPIHSSFTFSLNWLRTVRDRLCLGEEKRYNVRRFEFLQTILLQNCFKILQFEKLIYFTVSFWLFAMPIPAAYVTSYPMA